MPDLPEPTRVPWAEAPGVILDLVEQRRPGAERAVVGVTGRVSAGKSSLARRVAEAASVREAIVVTTDDYLPDYEGLPIEEVDLPEHSDLDLLAEHLAALREGRAVDMPEWSFHAHARVGTRRVEPVGLVVLEGLYALHKSILEVVDVAVVVEAGESVRWSRRERLEVEGERGWGVEKARAHFDAVAEPTFARFEDGYLAAADLLVLNHG